MIVALPQEKELNSDMSKILCIIDGMTDPYFRVSNYPNLSSMRLLRHVDTTQGQTPESLGCILRLLGVTRVPPNLRGYAEALGYGIPVNKDDLILRGSWFSLDEQGCCNIPTSAPKSLYGTQNIIQGSAMTREQAVQAITTGIELAMETDSDVIGIGEMGIGNTTTSSAVLSVLLDADVDAVTGRGGGIIDQSFQKKKQVIQTAIKVNQPDKQDVIDVLSKVGGFDIAAMCGAFIGCAATRRPVVIDGFISAVAALCAYKLCPNSVYYFIPSHASYEIGY